MHPVRPSQSGCLKIADCAQEEGGRRMKREKERGREGEREGEGIESAGGEERPRWRLQPHLNPRIYTKPSVRWLPNTEGFDL